MKKLKLGKCKKSLKNVLFVFSIAYVCANANSIERQRRMPTPADIDALRSIAAKMPTSEQGKELSTINSHYEHREGLDADTEKQEKNLGKILEAQGMPVTREFVMGSIAIHRRLQESYLNHIGDLQAWGRKYGRESCVRQAEKVRAYTIYVSDHWVAKATAIPLSTIEDRAYAALFVNTGGGKTFTLDPDPSSSIKNWAGMQIMGLMNVCRGANEFIPGA
jgi:hypothetical protein